MTMTNDERLRMEELNLEAEYKALGVEIQRKRLEALRTPHTGVLPSNDPLGKAIMGTEFTALQSSISEWIDKTLSHKRGVKKPYVDTLKWYVTDAYGPDNKDALTGMLTLATLSSLLNVALLRGSTPTVSSVALMVGTEIYENGKYDYYYLHAPKDKFERERLEQGLKSRNSDNNRRWWMDSFMETHKDTFTYPRKLDKTAYQSLGLELMTIIITKSGLFDLDAFAKRDTVMASDELIKGWDKNVEWLLERAAKYPPMIVKPAPWTNYYRGAYIGVLAGDHKLLRTHNNGSAFTRSYLKKLEQLNLDIVTTDVNAIQETSWRIDTNVLEVVNTIINHGGGYAGIPYMDTPPAPMTLSENPTEEEKKLYKKTMLAFYEEEVVRKSHCLRTLSTIKTAKRFKNYARIYFPCNMDFRGRVYPIPLLNCQGDDLTKGLIQFAGPTPVKNPEHIKWFYVAGANHAGVDKVSYDDRVKWVKDNHENIMGSATDPLGNTWWADQDEPFQFLQWCFEYKRLQEYLSTNNNDPTGFVTGTVIAYDGTCSGLQHFSALLRDPVGGTAVNLVPQDKPNDIYRIVADKVNEQLNKDALYGSEDEEKTCEDGNVYTKLGTKTLSLIWLTYGVNRKVTKRSVMTLAYGSKQYGFSEQLREDIINPDRRAKKEQSVFNKAPKQCASYLAKLIWDAVGTTVVAAVEGMKWLQTCAAMVTKKEQVVSWVTPAGLLVQQHYTEREQHVYQMRISNKRIRLYYSEDTDRIDKHHQGSGIAPNFIHSLDAAHLQRTVYACAHKGIKSYAMVHDSYGTSLGDAQTMFDTVRAEFYQMYTTCDPLATFSRHLSILAGNEKLPEIPAKGKLDLACVLDSQYIFS